MDAEQQSFLHLAVALAIGLLIGLERGWKEREAREGERVAGVRTYGLIGLLGGVWAMLGKGIDALLLGVGFLSLAVVLSIAYWANRRDDGDAGITSLVAALLAFAFGALAATGRMAPAAAFAVVTTLLLSYKPQLHHWVRALDARELRAGLQLLLLSVVLLPILPDRGYGPWQALNPYAIWWMVVLVAAISFVGYFAIRIGGPRRGAVFAGLFGGLASSTALTLHFARMARRDEASSRLLAMAILLACGTMLPRLLLIVAVLVPTLALPVLVPVAVMAAVIYLPALAHWRAVGRADRELASPLENPLELRAALSFGLVLAAVLLLGQALQARFGEAGVLALAGASGIANVDAITLSLSRMARDGLGIGVAAWGLVIAAAVNSVAKGAMAATLGGLAIARHVTLVLVASASAGLSTAWWWLG